MLTKIKFAPGIDKQDTAVGADGRWVDSDNVRFRYGLPEKVGGWQSLLTDTMVGAARKQHAFVDQDGNGNLINQIQSSGGHWSSIIQTGNNNWAIVSQS